MPNIGWPWQRKAWRNRRTGQIVTAASPPTRSPDWVLTPVAPKVRIGRGQDRPGGTRCYVPGYLDDNMQHVADMQQLGITPVAVYGAAQAGGLKISLKKGSPRMFGGPLVSTVNSFRSRYESGDVGVIREMDRARKTAKDKSAWQRIWNELLPTWSTRTAAQYELIKQLDPGANVSPPPSGAAAPPGVVTQPTQPGAQPVTQPITTQPVLPGTPSISITLPSPAPVMPIPPSQLPGGEPQVPSEAAPTQPVRAGMFGGDMGKLLIPGIVLLVASQVFGKKRR